MSGNKLKNSVVSGVLWTGTEKLLRQVVQFCIGIVLARLLSPGDYGVIGMLTIFIVISQAFADSGLSSALIQKKDRTDIDFSTMFYFNVVVSTTLYLILFFASPLIADFYNMPILKDVTRVVALSLVFTGLTSVQNTKLTIDFQFRKQSLISMISMFVTGATGLILAFNGFGVWALVFQALAGQICSSIGIWYASGWIPKWEFSKKSFSELWKFGSNILGSSLINRIYSNLYTLIIGKQFLPADVGFYNRANQYAILPVQTIQDVALKVNYPILAKIQDDNESLLRAYRKLMSVPLYVLYPILVGLAVTAPYLIPLMVGDKWIPAVPLLQVLCIGYMFSPLTSLNLNLLYVKGRTDLVLKLEFIKKPIAFAILFASIPFGLIWMVVGKAFYEFVAFSFNCYYTKKILGYGELQQLKVLAPIFANCAIMAMVIYHVMILFENPLEKLVYGVICGIISYLLVSVLFKDENLKDLIEIVKNKILVKFKR